MHLRLFKTSSIPHQSHVPSSDQNSYVSGNLDSSPYPCSVKPIAVELATVTRYDPSIDFLINFFLWKHQETVLTYAWTCRLNDHMIQWRKFVPCWGSNKKGCEHSIWDSACIYFSSLAFYSVATMVEFLHCICLALVVEKREYGHNAKLWIPIRCQWENIADMFFYLLKRF